MEDYLKQAFETANYMTTLADQKRIFFEEYQQNILYFFNGGCFRTDKELIIFVKCLIDLGRQDAVLVDDNNMPVDIENLKTFLDEILNIHFQAVNAYNTKYQKLRSSRSVKKLIEHD